MFGNDGLNGYDFMAEPRQLSDSQLQEINARLFFHAGINKSSSELRPWQYVEMEYDRLGLTAPQTVPQLDTLGDAEIWMCLDERVNRRVRMREQSLAG